MIIKFTIHIDLGQLKDHDVAPAKDITICAEPVPVPVTPNSPPHNESKPVTQSATTALIAEVRLTLAPIGEERNELENQNAFAQPTSAQPTSATDSFWSVLDTEISQTTPTLGQTTPVTSLPAVVDHGMNPSTPGPFTSFLAALLSRFGSRSVSPMVDTINPQYLLPGIDTRLTKYNKRQQIDNREAEGSNSKKRRM
ncbi:uncharacterized protein MELLADRAFT_62680 [Melampsora larici-populina 98AG31]|uniref:Uncharacterized protein n=1 Tax=Melampsora larici-populina (strain 98AG31 / pathotype 3-4-7) TaxID=747676 RepID=F4RJT4_MELLP|nr:uncharacterized protein MELLADRAFT_62680 [Melampsora larici-populina 98AG31]EGG07367.1 hypothetical protein MELLADRAFT_62680 [Melampsora larici-populina 98AG31]